MIRTKQKNRVVLLLAALLVCCSSFAADSVRILKKDDFLLVLRKYHPVVKQADLQIRRAGAEVLRNRGVFDPTIKMDLNSKSLDGKLYYSYLKPELTVPTWYGVDFKAGFEDATGDRLTSEATQGVVSYLGVKVPANNLVFDKRRAALQQARIWATVSEVDRTLIVNDLIFDALAAYFNWAKDFKVLQAFENQLNANRQRIAMTRIEVEQGSRAAIDTIEAQAQYEIVKQQRANALVSYRNSGLELSNYLWLDDGSPAYLNDKVLPDSLEIERQELQVPDDTELIVLSRQHPKLEAMKLKIEVLEIDRKLKFQSLFPKVTVNASMLSKGYMWDGYGDLGAIGGNNKFGIDVGMPILQREARGSLQSARIKIDEAGYDLAQKGLEIENKVRSYYNEYLSLKEQVASMQRAYINYTLLYRAEGARFQLGESTMFMVNTRELKMLETMQKLLELKAKQQKAFAGIYFAAGRLL